MGGAVLARLAQGKGDPTLRGGGKLLKVGFLAGGAIGYEIAAGAGARSSPIANGST